MNIRGPVRNSKVWVQMVIFYEFGGANPKKSCISLNTCGCKINFLKKLLTGSLHPKYLSLSTIKRIEFYKNDRKGKIFEEKRAH